MSSSLAKWEADPFFSAAEEVQNSADRMESALRTWKHLKGHGKPNCGPIINTYRRELITALDTVKWQLQEFERAVEAAVGREQHHRDKDAPSRHALFVGAIRSQVYLAEKALEDATERKDLAPTSVQSKQEDGNSLVNFLSGSSSDFNHGTHDNPHLVGIMHWKLSGSLADGNTEDKNRNIAMSLSESSPVLSEQRSSVECVHDRDIDGNFDQLHDYSNKGTHFVNHHHKSVLEQSLNPLENFSSASHSHETYSPSCTPDVWMSAGVSLEIVSNIAEPEVPQGTIGTRCSRFLNRELKDGENKSMEVSKDICLFPFVQMLKSTFMTDLEQGPTIKSGNCHKVTSGYVTAEVYHQKKRPATLRKALQFRSWMQQRVPHGRILQILSALLILISFVGISFM